MHVTSLANFDTSYWQPKDPAWLAAREAQWSEIEILLFVRDKSKKAVGIIKRYFFKGTLPDWDKLSGWDNHERHLDLMLFLYLHPSQDPAVLAPLRDAYIRLRHVQPRDIETGFQQLRNIGMTQAAGGGGHRFRYETVAKALPHLLANFSVGDDGYITIEAHIKGHSERLFRLLFTDPQQQVINLPKRLPAQIPQHGFRDVWEWSQWLTLELPLGPCASDMLYQYDYPLEFWYAQCGCDLPRFDQAARPPGVVELFIMAFYRFQHFFDVHTADDPRAPFVHKVVQMFDTRDFVPPVKLLWNEVKAGEVVVTDPWSPDCKLKKSALWSAFKIKPEWPSV